jgi:hypothetical protein
MRTTITLTPEAESLVKRAMQARASSFKEVVNEAIVAALAPSHTAPFRATTYSLGQAHPERVAPGYSLDQALALAGALEDEALLDKMELGK